MSPQRLVVIALWIATTAAAGYAQIPAHPECAATNLVENRVHLKWPDVPTDDTIAVLPDPKVDLSFANRSGKQLNVEVFGTMVASGKRVHKPLFLETLEPFADSIQSISLEEFGLDISQLEYSGSMLIFVKVSTSGGPMLERGYAPVLYFHQTPSSTFVYGAEARRRDFNCGDLFEQIIEREDLGRVVGIFDGGAGDGFDREDTGPRLWANLGRGDSPELPLKNPSQFDDPPWEFCLRWRYQSIDSGFGEDHYTSGDLMKARGMRVRIEHPNWFAPKEFFASQDNGCIQFHAEENSGFIVTVYAEARLGQNDNITIRAFDEEIDALQHPDEPPYWMFVANPGGAPRRVYYQNEWSEESNLMAFGSFVFHWVDHKTNPGLPGPAHLYLLSDNPDCEGSCQPGNFAQIQPGRTDRKFLVGHEVGHWIHRQWTHDDMGYDNNSWSANSSDDDCAFVGVGNHAMRSKEYAVGAFIEGFAHYISALAWNDHNQKNGWFKYYKEIDTPAYQDMEDDNWRVDIEGIGDDPVGGVSNWMENLCTVHDGHSVEMDWLRFWWDYRTNDGYLAKPGHYQIFRLIEYTMAVHPWFNNFDAFDRMDDAIHDAGLGQTNLLSRWNALSDYNGIGQ